MADVELPVTKVPAGKRSLPKRRPSLKQRAAAGRPPEPGPRDDSGRLRTNARGKVTWQRVRELAETRAVDPRMGYEIGRLSIEKLLTDTQCTIAAHVIGWYEKAGKVIRAPRRTPSGSAGLTAIASEPLTAEDIEEIGARLDFVDEAEIEARDIGAMRKLQGFQRSLSSRALKFLEGALMLNRQTEDELVPLLGALLTAIGHKYHIDHTTPLPTLPPWLRLRRRKPVPTLLKVKRKERTVPYSTLLKIATALRPDAKDRIAELLEATYDRERLRKKATTRTVFSGDFAFIPMKQPHAVPATPEIVAPIREIVPPIIPNETVAAPAAVSVLDAAADDDWSVMPVVDSPPLQPGGE